MQRSAWFVLVAVTAVAGSIASALAADAGYPKRAVRMIVPYPPGGAGDIVGRLLDHRLQAVDREKLASGDVRWRNRTQFVRLRLIEQGDLKKGSPRGLWELSDQGWRRVNGESRAG